MARTRRTGDSAKTVDVGGVAGERLKSFIERLERLEEEKKALGEDIKEVFAEAKGTGFDTKIMRIILRMRKMDKDDLEEEETLVEVYMQALGMLPLFEGQEHAEIVLKPEVKPAPKKAKGEVIEEEPLPDAVPTEADKAAAKGAARPIGEIASQVVETVKEMVEQNDAEKLAQGDGATLDAASAGAAPEDQMQAKLEGEKAGRKGLPKTANPHPVSHPLHLWWVRGHGPAYEAWSHTPAGRKARAAEGKTAGKAQPGYSDKTARMSAEQAKKLLEEPQGRS